MTSTALSNVTLPAEKEVEAAVQGQRALAAFLATGFETQRIQVLRLLLDILSELSNGNAVRVVPIHAELTTQEAADLLNVSRPHLVKLLEEGALPHHKTGKHRRVLFENLMQFKSERDRASEIAMEGLTKQAQELAMG